MTRNSTPAADQFAALGIPEADWTDTMRLAVKQRWTNLPVDEKVGVLREQIAAVTKDPTPTADELAASGFAGDPVKEAARLKRNAAVNAWRARGQLQAALDARELRFAAIRAHRNAA